MNEVPGKVPPAILHLLTLQHTGWASSSRGLSAPFTGGTESMPPVWLLGWACAAALRLLLACALLPPGGS